MWYVATQARSLEPWFFRIFIRGQLLRYVALRWLTSGTQKSKWYSMIQSPRNTHTHTHTHTHTQKAVTINYSVIINYLACCKISNIQRLFIGQDMSGAQRLSPRSCSMASPENFWKVKSLSNLGLLSYPCPATVENAEIWNRYSFPLCSVASL